jgi:hypothetical protein
MTVPCAMNSLSSSVLNTLTSWGRRFFKLTVDILSVIFILLMVLLGDNGSFARNKNLPRTPSRG